MFTNRRNHLKVIRENAKAECIQGKLDGATSSKDIHAIPKSCLHKNTYHPLPDHKDPCDIADTFSAFFSDKITIVRREFDAAPTASPCDADSGAEITLMESLMESFRFNSP